MQCNNKNSRFLSNFNLARRWLQPIRIGVGLIATCFVLSLSGCSGGGNNSSDGNSELSPQLSVQVESANRTVSMIDGTGGTIQSLSDSGQNYLLTLPAESISKMIDIGMTPVTSIGALDFVDKVNAGVQFEPDGLVFDKPSILDIELPGSINFSQLYALAWEGDGSQVALKLFTVDNNNHLKLVVNHFSGVAVISGNVNTASKSLNSANSNSIEQRYVALMSQDFQNSMKSADPTDVSAVFAAISKAVDTFAIKWLDDINALAKTDASNASTLRIFLDELKHVFAELNDWNANILIMMCPTIDCSSHLDAFNNGVNQVRTSMVKNLIGRFEQARDKKNDGDVGILINEVIILGLDYETIFRSLLSLKQENSLQNELIRLYARQLDIAVTGFPSTLTVGSDPATFSLKLSLASSGEPVANHAVSIGPEFDGCGELSYQGSTPNRGSLDLTTDAQGVIDGLALSATTTCSDPLDQSLIHLRAEDSFQGVENYGVFFGRNEIFSAANADEQLVILQTGFPPSIIQGGSSVDFSLRFSLLSNDNPLSNAEVFIGPNNQGCATLNGSRGYDRYFTDSNGEVTGLTLAAEVGISCTAPLDRSLIYVKVLDSIVASFTGSDKNLGKEIIFEALHKKSKFIFAFDSVTGTVSDIFTIGEDGSNLVNLTPGIENQSDPDISPDGSKIVYVSNSSNNVDIYLMNIDGSGKTRLTQASTIDRNPRWSPDGRKIAFVGGDDSLYIMDASGANQRSLGTPVNQAWAWSPDGTKIAFASRNTFNNGIARIYSVAVDGSSQNILVDSASYSIINYIAWSPDGSQIAYGNGGTIYKVSVNGGNEIKLTPDYKPLSTTVYIEGEPIWSPDGTKLIFFSNRRVGVKDEKGLFVMNSDGSNQTLLLSQPYIPGRALKWSTDGLKIAYLLKANTGKTYIHIMNPDGTGDVQLPAAMISNNFSWLH